MPHRAESSAVSGCVDSSVPVGPRPGSAGSESSGGGSSGELLSAAGRVTGPQLSGAASVSTLRQRGGAGGGQTGQTAGGPGVGGGGDAPLQTRPARETATTLRAGGQNQTPARQKSVRGAAGEAVRATRIVVCLLGF